ncbi:alpha/beta fold hydrolase [Streptomyces polyrhachis]|uniref:Alpha/beta fold hydrolase n=1 Tax=Streptomyces polyrhachis TaxID=1282885 RepID=A0ABW2GL23_9ACTN
MSSTELPGISPPAQVPDTPSRGSAAGQGPADVRQVALPGLTLAVRHRAPARAGLEPALYVHGLGGSALNWTALAAELADRVDGEALDLPGFGHSAPPDDGDYSISGHARAVVRYLDAAGRGPVHLFGNSMGGAVVTRVAAVRPDLVRTLTLVSPALPELRPQATALPNVLLAIPGAGGAFMRLTEGWSPERRTGAVLALCYGDPSRVTPEGFAEAIEEYQRRLSLPYHWEAMERSARGIVDAYTLGGRHGLWAQARRVQAPTLLVYGARDQLVSARMARKARRSFADSRLLLLPEAGHVAMMEYPRVVARAFGELLADRTTATTATTATTVRNGN